MTIPAEFCDRDLDENEVSEVIAHPAPWHMVPTGVTGFISLYDSRGEFVATAASVTAAERIVSAINQE